MSTSCALCLWLVYEKSPSCCQHQRHIAHVQHNRNCTMMIDLPEEDVASKKFSSDASRLIDKIKTCRGAQTPPPSGLASPSPLTFRPPTTVHLQHPNTANAALRRPPRHCPRVRMWTNACRAKSLPPSAIRTSDKTRPTQYDVVFWPQKEAYLRIR